MLSFSTAAPSKPGASTKEYAAKFNDVLLSWFFRLMKLHDFCFLVESRRAFLAQRLPRFSLTSDPTSVCLYRARNVEVYP
jgi:hypothetical protein